MKLVFSAQFLGRNKTALQINFSFPEEGTSFVEGRFCAGKKRRQVVAERKEELPLSLLSGFTEHLGKVRPFVRGFMREVSWGHFKKGPVQCTISVQGLETPFSLCWEMREGRVVFVPPFSAKVHPLAPEDLREWPLSTVPRWDLPSLAMFAAERVGRPDVAEAASALALGRARSSMKKLLPKEAA